MNAAPLRNRQVRPVGVSGEQVRKGDEVFVLHDSIMYIYIIQSMLFYTILETVCVNLHQLVQPPKMMQFYTMPTAQQIYEILEKRRLELGMSQAEVCTKAFGKADNSPFQSLRRGSAPAPEKLKSLSDVLDLEFYFGPRRDHGTVETVAIDGSEYAHVALHDAALSAGPGVENGGRNIVDHLAFRRDWLRNIGVSASDAVLARASGDSMWPTIHGGDIVLIDVGSQLCPRRVREPKDTRPVPIYALLDDGAARIKRLALATPGTMVLLSDNPECPPEFRPVTTLSVIGKVMWWGHTNKD